jgi:hypothetical protein
VRVHRVEQAAAQFVDDARACSGWAWKSAADRSEVVLDRRRAAVRRYAAVERCGSLTWRAA